MKIVLLMLPLLAATSLCAQNVNELNKADVENALKVKTIDAVPDSAKHWKLGGTVGANFTMTGLKNWQGGGQDALTLTGLFTGFANYVNGSNRWNNLLDMGYGITRLGGGQDGTAPKLRKSDDRLIFTSKYTRSLNKHWGFAGMVDFRTQFDKGYKYDVVGKKADGVTDTITDQFISDFLAPAFLVNSIGFEYKRGEMFYAMISPLTSKITIVGDKGLSDAGAYGVVPGKMTRSEFGAYLNTNFKYKLMENIQYQTNLNLFMNYKTPKLIDVFWDNAILMSVNKLVQVSFNTNLIYDDDIKIVQSDGHVGPRIQFKYVLAVGLTYKLNK
jgi:hypothetical protein